MSESAFNLSERLPHYARLMRIDRPIGTLLVLWPTLWGLWVAAGGMPPLHILIIFVLGTFLMRSAGCVINDYFDRDFDGHVERTRERPLATGKVTPREALWLAAALAAVAFLLVLFLNPLVILLAFPGLLIAATYPLGKRYIPIPQAYLGIAFGFGIPMAFAAVQGEVPGLAWLMLLANVFWSIAYDTEYAMVDRPDDLKIGIKSAAITFGRYEVTAIMISYAATLLLLAIAGAIAGLGPLYFIVGITGAAGIAYHHYGMIRERDRAGCFQAFLHNKWFGGVIFAGLVLEAWFR